MSQSTIHLDSHGEQILREYRSLLPVYTKMEEVIPAHAEMVEKYAEAIKRTKAIENDKDRDIEMSYWKMQGFFVKEFRIVDENVDR